MISCCEPEDGLVREKERKKTKAGCLLLCLECLIAGR